MPLLLCVMHTAYVPEEFMPIVAVFALFVHTLELYQLITKFTSELVTSTLFTRVEIQLCNSNHNTVCPLFVEHKRHS